MPFTVLKPRLAASKPPFTVLKPRLEASKPPFTVLKPRLAASKPPFTVLKPRLAASKVPFRALKPLFATSKVPFTVVDLRLARVIVECALSQDGKVSRIDVIGPDRALEQLIPAVVVRHIRPVLMPLRGA